MVEVYFGESVVAVRKKALSVFSAYGEKGFAPKKIDADTYVAGMCTDIAHAVSLFGVASVYLLDTPSSETVFNEEVLDTLAAFAESSDVFIVLEEKLLAPQKKIYQKHAQVCEEIVGDPKKVFNAFALVDSLLAKDKKTLWLQLRDGYANKLSAEEIIGTLWWQLKTLRLASITKNASEAGMKDFPYNKAKRALKNFKDGEIEILSRSLLSVYHDGHGGRRDIDLALEEWILSI
jgi:hypothetical protein